MATPSGVSQLARASGLSGGNHHRRRAWHGPRPTPRGASAVCSASPDGLLLSALDKVLNKITRIVFEHGQEQRRLWDVRRARGEPLEAEAVLPGKLIHFQAGSSAERQVKEPMLGSAAMGKSLADYLALPLDQYSLLDPRWITRPDAEAAPDVFVLKVPLQELLHVELQPQVTIKVTVNPEQSQVRFEACSFQVGDRRFDQCFDLDMDAKLSHRAPAKPLLGRGMAAALRSWRRKLALATGTHAKSGTRVGGASPPSAASAPLSDPGLARLGPALPEAQQPPHHHQHQHNAPPTAFEAPLSATGTAAQPLRGPAPSPATQQEPTHSPIPDSAQLTQSGGAAAATAVHAPEPSHSPTISTELTTVVQGLQGTQLASAHVEPQAADAGSLHCAVDLRFHVTLPPPLSVVPGSLLALAGGLIARLAVRALLPGFLELLSVDYTRWASGSSSRGQQAAGSLLPPTAPAYHVQPPPHQEVPPSSSGASADPPVAAGSPSPAADSGGGGMGLSSVRLGTAMVGLAAAVGVSATASSAPPPGA